MTSKPRILYLSSVIPDTSCGARIAIYRHFVERNDFEVAVASYDLQSSEKKNHFIIERTSLGRRISKTRFSRIYYNIQYFLSWNMLPKKLLSFALQFNPDVIMTVPDNLHGGLALNLSRKLKKPLLVNFQDLFPLSNFLPKYCDYYWFIRKVIMWYYKRLNKIADISLYTSEEMMKFFGNKHNGRVLYPIGDSNNKDKFGINRVKKRENKVSFTILYAGNCYGSYGRMLLKLAQLIKKQNEVHLKIFPVGKGWNDSEIKEMTEAGIYQQFLPFKELKKEFELADAFLTVMSFEPEDKFFVQTSFTTKWLDYAPYGKPILVWAPEYSSASRFAKKNNAGIVTEENSVNEFFNNCLKVAKRIEIQQTFGANAKKVSETVLMAENVHNVLKESVVQLINNRSK